LVVSSPAGVAPKWTACAKIEKAAAGGVRVRLRFDEPVASVITWTATAGSTLRRQPGMPIVSRGSGSSTPPDRVVSKPRRNQDGVVGSAPASARLCAPAPVDAASVPPQLGSLVQCLPTVLAARTIRSPLNVAL